MGSIPGSGRYPGEGNSNPLQCSCLDNFMNRRTWQATVHDISKSHSQLRMHTYTVWHKMTGKLEQFEELIYFQYLQYSFVIVCVISYEDNVKGLKNEAVNRHTSLLWHFNRLSF